MGAVPTVLVAAFTSSDCASGGNLVKNVSRSAVKSVVKPIVVQKRPARNIATRASAPKFIAEAGLAPVPG
ncbi:MAG: hypothetical protein ACC631_04605 [Halocynthiibacter sp.]